MLPIRPPWSSRPLEVAAAFAALTSIAQGSRVGTPEPKEDGMSKQVDCPCGVTMTGEDDDELVTRVEAHVRDKHPEMADSMTREKILGMASESS